MTQEGKQLLLQELCARLPYFELIVQYKGEDFNIIDIGFERVTLVKPFMSITSGSPSIEEIKPYLRPMSSMTKEERKMFWEELDKDMDILESNIDAPIICEYNGRMYRGNPTHHEIDFLNRNMFDWRGLIPMGLAIEAPEGMYNTKTE